MTKRHLRGIIFTVIGVYVLAIIVGIWLAFEHRATAYPVFKDLVPLIIAFPGAYLVAAFQRRAGYLSALRSLWSHLVDAVSTALVYCDLESPQRGEYADALRKLSAGIEEVRGVFKNIPVQGKPEGWYPFEPLRDIYHEIKELGFGDDATADRRARAGKEISRMWRPVRDKLLAEFERDKPTHHHVQKERVLAPASGQGAGLPAGPAAR